MPKADRQPPQLRPPKFVPMSEEQEQEVIRLLASFFCDALERFRTTGVWPSDNRPADCAHPGQTVVK
jgi:hypothetical protein